MKVYQTNSSPYHTQARLSPKHHKMISSPADPASPYSKTARLACWLTGGGTRRPPSTAISLLKMAHERNTVKNAKAEWTKRKKAALAVHMEQWGNTGLMGMIEEVAAVGPRPRGTALLRWVKERHGEGGRGVGEGQRLRGVSESDAGRSTGDNSITSEPAGQQAADNGLSRAEDVESVSVSGEHHVEVQEDTAPAAHEDEVDAGYYQGPGISASEARRGEDSS